MEQQTLIPEPPCFLLDSTIVIEITRRAFPINKFPVFHSELEKLIASGAIKSVEEVKKEFEDGTVKQPDVTLKWCEEHPDFFQPIDDQMDLFMGTASELFRLDILKIDRPYADPHLLAYALAHKSIIVTNESSTPNPNKPKIPEVCAKLDEDIRCIDIWQFLKESGLISHTNPTQSR